MVASRLGAVLEQVVAPEVVLRQPQAVVDSEPVLALVARGEALAVVAPEVVVVAKAVLAEPVAEAAEALRAEVVVVPAVAVAEAGQEALVEAEVALQVAVQLAAGVAELAAAVVAVEVLPLVAALEAAAEEVAVVQVAAASVVLALDSEAAKMPQLHRNKSNTQGQARSRTAHGRGGFSLLELMLALALIVMATAIIGSLLQMYSRNFATRGEDIRRKQLARALLNMIAEDIRAVVLEQEYDDSVLAQQLGAGGDSGGGGGGGAAGGAADAGAGGSGLASDAAASGDSAASDPATDDAAAEEMIAVLPPGIYGDQYSLTVDVSRLPRPDEYNVMQNSLLSGTLVDVPGDIKTVTYYVQTATNQGVADDMAGFASAAATSTGFTAGLVRRALDRGVMAYAQELGDVDRLNRTGDLVAPEVVALEFAFFDSELGEWVYEWDSSQQSLPWLVQISLAMQSATAAEQSQVEPGTPLTSITFEDQRALGIEVYELVVAIPGANLVAAEAAQDADMAAGMENLGL